MHNSLRTDVHITSGGHLPILRNTERIKLFPIVGRRIVRDYHAVGDHYSWRIGVAGKQTHRMPGIHDQRLLIIHRSQILHCEQILRPVLKDRSIPAVGNQFMRVLRYSVIQVILNHQHDRFCLQRLTGIVLNRSCFHLIIRTKTIHINPAILLQFLAKLRQKFSVKFWLEITQRISQCQLHFFFA